MKKAISIVIIFSILTPFWISYTVFQFEKQCIKREIKKQLVTGISVSELQFLKFSKEEAEKKLNWEHSKEFEYLDVMYDVIKSESKNDSVFYWCWQDNKETVLNKRLKQLVKNEIETNSSTGKNYKRLSTLISSFYFVDDNPFEINRGRYKEVLRSFYLLNYSSHLEVPLTPPPRQTT